MGKGAKALAKALETEVSKQELANSPTLTLEATREGIVLGTAAYMSPEQARGREVDKRTDIWSFGLVLFEMLTGEGMYAGKSFPETLAAVIHQEPRLEELRPDTPRKIRELLERCLRRDSRMRLRDVGDARITIHECLTGTAVTAEEVLASPPSRPLSLRLAPWAIAPLLAVVTWAVQQRFLVSGWEPSRLRAAASGHVGGYLDPLDGRPTYREVFRGHRFSRNASRFFTEWSLAGVHLRGIGRKIDLRSCLPNGPKIHAAEAHLKDHEFAVPSPEAHLAASGAAASAVGRERCGTRCARERARPTLSPARGHSRPPVNALSQDRERR